MRRLILSLAVATVIGTGLAAALPGQAHAQYYGGYYDHDGWRDRAWHHHMWREWMWRHHLWREWHEGHFDH